jgi:hypothetical protein
MATMAIKAVGDEDGWIDNKSPTKDKNRTKDIWNVHPDDTDQDIIIKKRKRTHVRNGIILGIALISVILAIVLMSIGLYAPMKLKEERVFIRIGAFFAALCCLCLLLSFNYWFEYVTTCCVTVIEDREEIQSGCVKNTVELYRILTGPPYFFLPILSLLCMITAGCLFSGYLAGQGHPLLLAAEITGISGIFFAIISFQGILKLVN